MQHPKSNSKSDFGDFEEIKDDKVQSTQQMDQTQAPARVRVPRNKELIGVILQRLGGNRMEIKTTDGKTRNCRVPGRYRRRLWLRPKDIVMIIPDEYNDGKGDGIYKYPPVAVKQLRKNGVLDSLTNEF
jgi:translation initiation factor 1A